MTLDVCLLDGARVGRAVRSPNGCRVESTCFLGDDSDLYSDGVGVSCDVEEICIEGFDSIFSLQANDSDARFSSKFINFFCVELLSVGVMSGPSDISSGALSNRAIRSEMYLRSGFVLVLSDR